MKTRFAPSPSGHLHVGGARTALFNFAYARRLEGSFLLRIEDTDQKRSSDAASIGFLKDLAWLGIRWDEGPEFADGHVHCGGGKAGPYFQSERLEVYADELNRLVREGKAYHAFDTPDELEAKRQAARAEGRSYRYDRAGLMLSPDTVQRYLDEGRPSVVRFKAPEGPVTIADEVLGSATLPAGEVDDFVIRKADGYPTYHFAVVVDDELMGVTHVLRAQEHFNNTAKHILLQDALGYRRPVYAHLAIICNPDGSKMSKRDKDRILRAAVKERGLEAPPHGTMDDAVFEAWVADKNVQLDLEHAMRLADALDVQLPEINVDDFRRSGYLPEVLVNFLALNGWSPGGDREKFDLAFICREFDLPRVIKTPARFDRTKLLAFNLDALQAMPREAFVDRVRAHGDEFHPFFMEHLSEAQFELLAAASHERSKTLDDMFRTNRWVLTPDEKLAWEDTKPVRKALTGGGPTGLDQLRALQPILADLADWTVPELERVITEFAQAHAGGQLGRIAQPLRIAVSGGTVSPAIFDTLAILGKKSTLRRIERCLEWAAASAGLAG
ncbi:MAG: glutamate--tRNA ligase [Phycisphaerales bacterium]|nr:glutamate--tRNA ligase [Phycisphaerales bacterium]